MGGHAGMGNIGLGRELGGRRFICLIFLVLCFW
jgi:hypothetical protein